MLQNINFSNPTWDLFVLVFFIAASFIFGISLGKARIIVILVSLYMTMAVLSAAPFLKQMDADLAIPQMIAIKVSVFMIAFIGIFFLVSRSALTSTIVGSDEQGSIWQIILFSFFLVGLLIDTVLTYTNLFSLEGMSPAAKMAFGSDWAKFFWVAAPVVAMILLRKKQP